MNFHTHWNIIQNNLFFSTTANNLERYYETRSLWNVNITVDIEDLENPRYEMILIKTSFITNPEKCLTWYFQTYFRILITYLKSDPDNQEKCYFQ